MADEATKQFYTNLPISAKSRYIRLLHVQAPNPTAGTTGGPIHCTVTVVDLDAEPHYTALSYVWGSMAPNPDVIFCNDVTFRVTSNCHSALHHLRAIHGAFTIWIDAISLNQQDNLEKAHQIGLMGDIYSGAETTYVWLGEGSASTDRAMEYLSRCGFLEYFFAIGEDFKTSQGTKPRPWAAYLSHLKGQYGFDRSTVPLETESRLPSLAQWRQSSRQEPLCTLEDLEAFFDCDWISRIWTYQELMLSRNPVVLRGSLQISWSRLQFSIIFLLSIRADLITFQKWSDVVFSRDLCNARVQGLTKHNLRLLTFWTFCRSIIQVHKWYVALTCILCTTACLPTVTLLSSLRPKSNYEDFIKGIQLLLYFTMPVVGILLSRFIQLLMPNPKFRYHYSTIRICENFQDQIIESLCTRNATDPKDMFFGIHSILEKLGPSEKLPPVDYSLPCAQIYTNLTRYLLSEGDSLLPLTLAAQKRCKGAPSWVPDYSQGLSVLKHDISHRRDGLKFIDATYGSLPYRRFHPKNASILVVKGYILTTVTEVSKSSNEFLVSSSLMGSPATEIRAGDQVALISGLPFPIVVRRKRGGLVKLIGSALLTNLNCSPLDLKLLWYLHVRQRRKKWFETERSCLSLGSVIEDNPERYLDDLYIS